MILSFGGKFFKKLKSLILGLASSLNEFITELLGNFSRECWQSSFSATTGYTISSNRRAHSSCLDVKVRQSEYASQDAAIDINVLNAIIRNGYILFVDNPELLAKTSVGEFVVIKWYVSLAQTKHKMRKAGIIIHNQLRKPNENSLPLSRPS